MLHYEWIPSSEGKPATKHRVSTISELICVCAFFRMSVCITLCFLIAYKLKRCSKTELAFEIIIYSKLQNGQYEKKRLYVYVYIMKLAWALQMRWC